MRGSKARELRKTANMFYTDKIAKAGVSFKKFCRMLKKQYMKTITKESK